MGVPLCGTDIEAQNRAGQHRLGMNLVEAHVLRQLCGILEAPWAEWAGVRWTSTGAVRGAVPGQVAGALEGLATGATREGLEVRVRHAVALQP